MKKIRQRGSFLIFPFQAFMIFILRISFRNQAYCLGGAELGEGL